MAYTLAEANKLATDNLLAGVLETLTTKAGVLSFLPWITVVGNALAYRRQNAAPTVSFHDVGDTWTEDTPTFTEVTTALKILGGDADVDNFLQATRANVQDLEAETIILKAAAWRDKFEDMFINGSVDSDATQFDGLQEMLDDDFPAAQTVSMGTNGATLTLAKLDEMIDAVRPGKPDLLVMSRRSRRSLNSLVINSGAGQFIESTKVGDLLIGGDGQAWTPRVTLYDGIPIVPNDFISDAQTKGSSTDCSRIFAVKFDAGAGLHGLSAPGTGGGDSPVMVERLGSLETKDATRTRVKGYVSLACFHTQRIAQVTGVRP